MRVGKGKLVILFILYGSAIVAQPSEKHTTRDQYVKKWKDEAIRQMLEFGIPASITLAQGILESDDGNSALARYANNHFGIKCHDWDGESFIKDDDTKDECFRKYSTPEESFADHSQFLISRERYSFLFEIRSTNYKAWAKGLKKAGYATSSKYAEHLIKIIEDNNLERFDKLVKTPTKEVQPPEVVYVPNQLILVKRTLKITDNDVKYVIAKQGDTPFKLAHEFDMWLKQIYKYNDLVPGNLIHEGDIIYLQPKKNKARIKFYTVQAGDTMYEISQKMGIKLKALYDKNNMVQGTQPAVGQVLNLRRKKK